MITLAVVTLLWYIPLIGVTITVHLFVDRLRSYGMKSYYALAGFWLLLILATVLAMSYLQTTLSVPLYMAPPGLLLLACGLALLFWSYKTLSFRTLIWFPEIIQHASNGNALVRSGPYKFCRHPVYSAVLAILVAVFLLSGVLGLVVPVVMLLTLIVCEEKELRSRFGNSYERYSSETPMLLVSGVRRRGGPGNAA